MGLALTGKNRSMSGSVHFNEISHLEAPVCYIMGASVDLEYVTILIYVFESNEGFEETS